MSDLASRQHPPEPEEPREFRFPSFTHHTLDNGIGVYISHYPRGPLVHVSIGMTGGAEGDPPELAGCTTLAASLIDEGTTDCSSLELARRVENLGGYLATQADWDSMTAWVGMLANHLEEGFGLLADIVTDAVLPDHEVERLRGKRLAEIQRQKAQPGVQASHALSRLIYGSIPYGAPLNGTEESTAALSREDLLACVARHATPSRLSVLATGELDSDRFLRLVSDRLTGWNASELEQPAYFEPTSLNGLRLQVVDRPDSPQTEFRFGHVGPRRNNPDYVPLQVLNSLLGGKFTSRINLNLREDLGITYGASSGFGRRRGHGPFVVSASISTDGAGKAVEQVLWEIRRVQEELVDQQELDETKSYLLGVFPYTLQRIEGLAGRIAEIATYNLPHDYYDLALESIRRVDVEQIQRLAQEYLHPDDAAVVMVGPAIDLLPQLERFGEVDVVSGKTT